MSTALRVHPEVADARTAGAPVVALESTIFSGFGLPEPVNAECLAACVAAVRTAGAVPAVTVVLDGVARVGVDDTEHERVLAAAEKLAARDLPAAVARRTAAGATTVSAALFLAARAGVPVFATGGIGGVHRGVTQSGDVSADLAAIARHPVTTVTAGAKAFLDLNRTVERLETLGVPVLGLATDEFPAFYSRQSGVALPERVETPDEAAGVIAAARSIGHDGGLLLAVPIPPEDEIPASELTPVIDRALDEAEAAGVAGAAVTPHVLARISEATDGRTLPANVALAAHNAAVAAAVAVALTAPGPSSTGWRPT